MSGTRATVGLIAALLDRLVGAVERIEARAGISDSDDGLLTKQQVAKRLGGNSSVRKVERLVKAGRLKKVPGLGARTVRFRLADVERLTADKENTVGRCRL